MAEAKYGAKIMALLYVKIDIFTYNINALTRKAFQLPIQMAENF